MSTLGERIKEIRQENNFTQQQFADKISVSRPFISRIESNKEIPSDSLLKLIIATFEIKWAWIKWGLGDKKEKKMPYSEMRSAFIDGTFIEKSAQKLDASALSNYAFIFSVLSNILKCPNVKENSSHFYQEQIKSIVVLIDGYIRIASYESQTNDYSLFREDELDNQLGKEFLENIRNKTDEACRALNECNLDEELKNG